MASLYTEVYIRICLQNMLFKLLTGVSSVPGNNNFISWVLQVTGSCFYYSHKIFQPSLIQVAIWYHWHDQGSPGGWTCHKVVSSIHGWDIRSDRKLLTSKILTVDPWLRWSFWVGSWNNISYWVINIPIMLILSSILLEQENIISFLEEIWMQDSWLELGMNKMEVKLIERDYHL